MLVRGGHHGTGEVTDWTTIRPAAAMRRLLPDLDQVLSAIITLILRTQTLARTRCRVKWSYVGSIHSLAIEAVNTHDIGCDRPELRMEAPQPTGSPSSMSVYGFLYQQLVSSSIAVVRAIELVIGAPRIDLPYP